MIVGVINSLLFMVDFRAWEDAQIEERKWWGNFVNTFVEEEKQFYYAEKMEIYFSNLKSLDLFQQSILDIGSNAVSMLLKTYNGKRLTVVDPISIPQWALDRYKANNIEYLKVKGEDIIIPADPKSVTNPLITELYQYDECWIYNCLQHTQDPEKIVNNAIRHSKVLRIFEWLGHYENKEDKESDKLNKIMHPIILTESDLNKWIGKRGSVESVNLPLVKGNAYYGVFIK